MGRICCCLVLLLSSVVGCSAIKIETGQTRDEAVASSESQAGNIRSEWADRLRHTTPPETAQHLIRHIDSVGARYLAYGFQVGDEWRQGNAGRGEDVPEDEMRQVVAAWTENQLPVLTAWEDNLEYALELVRESRYFDSDFMQSLQNLTDQYYRVYSIVFYPAGDVEKYETALHEARRQLESLSAVVKEAISRY